MEPGHGDIHVDNVPSVARAGSLLDAIYRGGYPGLLEFETAEIPDSYPETILLTFLVGRFLWQDVSFGKRNGLLQKTFCRILPEDDFLARNVFKEIQEERRTPQQMSFCKGRYFSKGDIVFCKRTVFCGNNTFKVEVCVTCTCQKCDFWIHYRKTCFL